MFNSNHKSALFRLIYVLLLSGLFSVQAADMPWGNGQSQGKDLQIKLVTFGVGDEIPAYWGHTALIVEDVRLQKARIYNYGLFSFGDGMLLNFLMGRLIFSGGAFSVPSYLNYYRNMDREIRILTLDIPDAKKKDLAFSLAQSVLPENRDYLYHHYFDNCATRLRDYLDQALDGQFKKATQGPARMDLRDHTRRYTARTPWLELGLMFLMNNEIDQPIQVWDEMFLPDELERQVLKLSVADSAGSLKPFVKDQITIYKPQRDAVPQEVPLQWPLFMICGLVLAGLGILFALFAIRNAQSWAGTFFGAWQALTGIVLGLPGTILFLMSVFTEHTVTYNNVNLFFAHPVYLLLVYFGARFAYGNLRSFMVIYRFWVFQLALTCVGLIINLFPFLKQDNSIVLAFILPLILGLSLSTLMFKKGFKQA